MSHRARLLEETRRVVSKRAEVRAALRAQAARPPEPGDVFATEPTAGFGVEWAILARDGADDRRLLAVPADGGALVGSGDVEVLDSVPAGALTLRCRFGTWLDAGLLAGGKRVGVLAADDVDRARERWSAIFRGEAVGSMPERETDEDPEYRDWVEDYLEPAQKAMAATDPRAVLSVAPPARDVAQARGARREARVAGEVPRSGGATSTWRRLVLAASIPVVAGSLGLWRQHQTVRDLSAAREIAEEDSRRSEQRLAAAREGLERDLRQARADAAEARQRQQREVGERLADLNRRLQEAQRASTIRNPVIIALEPPGELRGEVNAVKIPAGASHALLLLPLRDVSPSPKYRAELLETATGRRIWADGELTPMKPGELRLGFPVSLLVPGEYRLRLWDPEDGGSRPLKESVFRIEGE